MKTLSVKRWTKILDMYYTDLSTNFLEGDLKHAGFQVNSLKKDTETKHEYETNDLKIKVTIQESPVTNKTKFDVL